MRIIKNYPKYMITPNGKVFSLITNKYLKAVINSSGYLVVGLYHNNKRTTKLVHRLVAEAYIPNPDELPEVNHIDENVLNNNISNLEWVTKTYNINYGTHNKRAAQSRYKSIRVWNDEFNKSYISIKDASSELGIHASHISQVLNGTVKQAKGYYVEYLK